MPFFLSNSFDEKIVQKCFKLFKKLDRVKAPRPNEDEILCLLCDDLSPLLVNIIFCTDEAVYYLTGTGIALCKYDFSSISAVTLEVVHSFSSVCLTISNGEMVKLYVATKSAEKMAEYIKSRIFASTSSPTSSAADEIMKYKNLLDCGAITEAEYEMKKKQLLNL